MAKTQLWARVWRIVLAGPITLLATLVIMAAGSLWLPEGEAQVNHFVIPVVLLPAIWAVLFFYSCLDRLGRASAVIFLLLAVNGAMLGQHMMHMMSAP